MVNYIKNNKIILLLILLIICICLTTNTVQAVQEETQVYEFKESIEEFNNPDRGIYRPTGIRCKAIGEWSNTKVQYANGLVHLRLGLKSFSGNGNGERDYDITEEHINKLNEYMEQIRTAGGTAIVRFAYDDYDGIANLEPDIEQVLKHIEQLEPFFKQNEDIIASVETGFLGPWGEQHSSRIVTPENLRRVTQKLLEVVPENRTVSVRRPLWYCYTTGVNIDEIDKDVTKYGTDAYRIGVFNDGYLGSASDLGTFVNRQREITWLNNQATHTLYGGEAVSAGIQDKDENGNLYNSLEHIQEEMFLTHTSYLNEEWNYNLIQSWKNTQYSGHDELYKDSTAFTYIKNHLGYRFVLTETEIPKTIEQSSSNIINIKLKNVGAGNVVNEKTTYIVLKNEYNEYSIPTSIDVRNWNSLEYQDFNIELPINDNINLGNYDVYVKITNTGDDVSTNKRTIRFANENVWNEELGANKIGNVEITKKSIQNIIKGDVDKDGNVTVNDLALMKLYCIDLEELDDIGLKAADLDEDNSVTVNDLALLKLSLVELIPDFL